MFWKLWQKIEWDEAGQGQTEYMILLSLAVLTVMAVIVGLGVTLYYLWDDIIATLPF